MGIDCPLGVPRAFTGGTLCLQWARGSGQRPLLPTPSSSHTQPGCRIEGSFADGFCWDSKFP